MKLMHRWYLLGATLIFGIGGLWYYSTENVQCLNDGEKAIYEIIDKGNPGRVRVSVIDTKASTTVSSRELEYTAANHYRPIELQRCNLYMLRKFNYDPKKSKQDIGYKDEIWQYSYDEKSTGHSTLLLTEKKIDGSFVVNYSLDFRIDPAENYIALERSSLGKPDYALVIKDIETGKDEYTLSLSDIVKKYPRAEGGFRLGEFYEKQDGTYLYGNLQDGSRWTALYSIKMGTWETEVLETPDDYLPGVERGARFGNNTHLAYSDLVIWAGGVGEIQDAILADAIAEGRKKNLFIANLRTGKKITVATVPIVKGHRFNLSWLSDTELQYTMPDGTVKTYVVPEEPASP